MILLKTKSQILMMHEANKIVHHALDLVATHLDHGGTTQVLNDIAENVITVYKTAIPTFKGYRGFPAAICVSINDEVVHGIPSNKRIMKQGDVVSIDFGVTYKGFVGDAARTYIVGENTGAKYTSDKIRKLNEDTRLALLAGIDKMVVGNRLHDISAAIDDIARANGYGNVRAFCGHGVGENLHEDPRVLNYVDPQNPNPRLQEGMVLAIEPMFTLGSSDVKLLDDKWTVVTKDGSIAAHWEVSVAVTNEGPLVLGKSNL
jgi:methionyl aminopeptidase